MLTCSYITAYANRGVAPLASRLWISPRCVRGTTAMDPAHEIPGDERNCGDWANGKVL